jgi:hypothetical protein
MEAKKKRLSKPSQSQQLKLCYHDIGWIIAIGNIP